MKSAVKIAMAAMMVGAITTATPALADDSTPITTTNVVTLTGTIHGPASALRDTEVFALTADYQCQQCGNAWQLVNAAYVDPATGTYSLEVGPHQVVRIEVRGRYFYANTYGHAPSREDFDASAGTDINVGDSNISELDIEIIAMSGITGTVTLPPAALRQLNPYDTDGQSIGLTLTAWFKVSKGPFVRWMSQNYDVPMRELSESYAYRMPVTHPGTYRVSVTGYLINEQFFGGNDLAHASEVIVSDSNDAAGVDFAPTLRAIVSGTLVPPAHVALDKYMMVAAYPFQSDGTPVPQDGAATADPIIGYVDPDGTYALPLPAGLFGILVLGRSMYGFWGPEPDCFAHQAFDSGCYPQPLEVTEGVNLTGIDIALRQLPRITGTVTLPENVSPDDLVVGADVWNGQWAYQDATATFQDNGNGTYDYILYARTPGTYRVTFRGSFVEDLIVGGGEDGPNADAVTIDSLTSPDVVVNVTLQAKGILEGSVDPSIMQGSVWRAYVSAVPCDSDYASDPFSPDARNADVDLATMTFSMPIPEGCFNFWLIYSSWNDGQEFSRTIPYLGDNGAQSPLYTLSGGITNLTFSTSSPDAPSAAWVESVGANSATIAWTAPTFTGGSPITGYTVTAVNPLPVAGPDDAVHTCTANPAETSCTIIGLDNLREYKFSVQAENIVGLSQSKYSDVAVPFDDAFQVWLPQGNAARDSKVSVWILGARQCDAVNVKIGGDVIETVPNEIGQARVTYFTDSSSANVTGGKIRVVARAACKNGAGKSVRTSARTMLYVPKMSVKASWKEGASVTARVTAAQPGTTINFLLNSATPACSAEADASGRATCTFDAPVPGDYWLTAATDGAAGFEIGSKDFTVKPTRKR